MGRAVDGPFFVKEPRRDTGKAHIVVRLFYGHSGTGTSTVSPAIGAVTAASCNHVNHFTGVMFAKEYGKKRRVYLYLVDDAEPTKAGAITKDVMMKLKVGILTFAAMLALPSVGWTHETKQHHLNYKSSVAVKDSKAPLHSLAKVNLGEAVRTAEQAIKGKAVEAVLAANHGYLTYLVTIGGPEKTTTDVVVDAGNGSVLDKRTMKLDAANDSAKDEHEHD